MPIEWDEVVDGDVCEDCLKQYRQIKSTNYPTSKEIEMFADFIDPIDDHLFLMISGITDKRDPIRVDLVYLKDELQRVQKEIMRVANKISFIGKR